MDKYKRKSYAEAVLMQLDGPSHLENGYVRLQNQSANPNHYDSGKALDNRRRTRAANTLGLEIKYQVDKAGKGKERNNG